MTFNPFKWFSGFFDPLPIVPIPTRPISDFDLINQAIYNEQRQKLADEKRKEPQ